MHIFSDLSALRFVKQNLGLVFGCSCHAGNFQLCAKLILISNVVIREVVAGGGVLQKHCVFNVNGLALAVLSAAGSGLNSPHSVVCLLVIDADFLVSAEAGEGHWSQRQGVKVQFTLAQVSIRAQSNVLAVSDNAIAAVISMLESENTARTGTSLCGAGGHSEGIGGDHLFIWVGNHESISVAAAELNVVSGAEGAILSVGKSNTN